MHDATTDPSAVRALFAAAPRATGYGIACGRAPHRLIGIDLDVDPAYGSDAAGALRQLALQHLFTIPPTVTVLTPSGGRHLWLTGPADATVPNSAGRLAPGIDIRGSGGYLVGPGSVTAHGRYRLAPGTAHLTPAPCPRALLRLLTPPPGRTARTGTSSAPGRASGPATGTGSGPGAPATAARRGEGWCSSSGRPRGPAQHPPVLGGLPRLRTRLRRRPGGRAHRRRRPHRTPGTRGPRRNRLGGTADHGTGREADGAA